MKILHLSAALFLSLWLAQMAAPSVGLPFLRLSSGPRGAALGEATTALLDVEATSANPAALQGHSAHSFAFTHGAWIQEISHDYFSLVFTGQQQTWGIAARFSQADQIERRSGPTAEPLGTFGVYDGALSLTYAHRWNRRLRVGASLKLIRQAIATQTATGAALDMGLLYAFGEHVHLGLALRDLGRMNDLAQTATKLPRGARLGVAYTGLSHLLVSLEAQQVRGGSTTLHLGGEWAVTDKLALRGGYQNAESRGLSLGAGLSAGRWSVEYAFIPFKSGLGEAHRLGVQLHR